MGPLGTGTPTNVYRPIRSVMGQPACVTLCAHSSRITNALNRSRKITEKTATLLPAQSIYNSCGSDGCIWEYRNSQRNNKNVSRLQHGPSTVKCMHHVPVNHPIPYFLPLPRSRAQSPLFLLQVETPASPTDPFRQLPLA